MSPGRVVSAEDCRGLTLLELLVALAILTSVSLLALGSLRQVLDARHRSDAQMQRLLALQGTLAQLGQDLTMAIPRGIRDESGAPRPALLGQNGSTGAPRLELTRTATPGKLGRIAYRLDEQGLVRLAWPALDRAPESSPALEPLLGDVATLEIRFLDENRIWREVWPPPRPREALPLAIEVTLVPLGGHPVRRLYPIPGGHRADDESPGTTPGPPPAGPSEQVADLRWVAHANGPR